ncbi:hypothetical protein Tsubulata_042350 [Turnera subulata]|uniref:Uncharacterized protein n=1 Tax=Turnera subulata TaxID=218843 RepID=A0A9Q0G7Y0_9ROSI|nr:hypothetical protein Tsubulata_042350 [Turnera subulata]
MVRGTGRRHLLTSSRLSTRLGQWLKPLLGLWSRLISGSLPASHAINTAIKEEIGDFEDWMKTIWSLICKSNNGWIRSLSNSDIGISNYL